MPSISWFPGVWHPLAGEISRHGAPPFLHSKRAPSRVPSVHLLFKSLDSGEENPADVFYLGPYLFHFFVFLQVFYAFYGDLNIIERFQNRFTALSKDIYISEQGPGNVPLFGQLDVNKILVAVRNKCRVGGQL